MIKIIVLSIFTILIFLLLAPTAKSFAQNTGYDMTVSPVFFDLTGDPGTTITTKVRIRNNTNSPIPIKLGVEKIVGDQNGNITLKDNNDQTLSWIKFTESSIVTKPLEWTDVPLTIDIPKDAAYGYYWEVSFSQDKNSPLAKTGVSLTGAAAVPILLNVIKPGAKAEAKIVDFSVKNFITEYLPTDFTVKVQNTGNIHVKPHGNIFISDGRNKDLAIIDVNSGLGNVIPNSSRIFTASWNDGFLVEQTVLQDGQPKLDKNGKPMQTLQINWNKLTSFRIGKYTANLVLVFDNGKRDVPLQSTITFWVFPYKALAVIGIAVIALVLVVRFLLKYYINREIRRRLKPQKS